jgi:hypothetical protein
MNKKNIALPRTIVAKGTYTGERKTPIRHGAQVHDRLPSRVGDTLHYRDGTKAQVK